MKLNKLFYVGLFLLSFSLLASQFLLTRFLSLVYANHFVFLIISTVMFGMTLGTLIVYFKNKIFVPEKNFLHIAHYCYLSGITLFISCISLFYLPLYLDRLFPQSYVGIEFFFPILAIPFTFLGIAFSLLLTRFPEAIGKIYAVNLFGSASGCIGAYFLLNNLNGPSALFILAALCLISAVFFFLLHPGKTKVFISFSCLVISIFLFAGIYNQSKDDLFPTWAQGYARPKPMYSKWNFFSYVSVGIPSQKPFGWGFSEKAFEVPIKTHEWMIVIDENAGTVVTKFNDIQDMDYLKYDITNLGYYIRPPQSVLVLGSGGGRDLMSAILFKAKHATGVELNKNIMDIAYNKKISSLPDFPQISIHNDDGRSFIVRSKDQYDFIQSSLVDSFAAAGTGAFALTENSLYTKEAWVIYLKHLSQTGVLSFARWHHAFPIEIYRLLSLAQSSLKEIGISDARKHVVIIRTHKENKRRLNVATILVSKTPFSTEELDALDRISKDLGFEVIFSVRKSSDPVYEGILQENYRVVDNSLDIAPTVDNRPFYFYNYSIKNFLSAHPQGEGASILHHLTLWILLFAVAFIILPLVFSPIQRGFDPIKLWPSVYFSCIGIGFMFLEIALIQRFGLYLGHPVYGLMVVLFTLLLFCGIGSFFAPKIGIVRVQRLTFPLLLMLILFLAVGLPDVLSSTASLSISVKVIIAGIFMAVSGLLMGMCFPTGVLAVCKNERTPLIFYWAINGFTSTCASALATVFLIHLGFQITIFFSLIMYFGATICLRKI